MTSVSPVRGLPCSFARLVYTSRNVRRRSHRVLSPPGSGNDQQMSRSIAQPLQLDVSRKTSTTVPLKLSKCLYNMVHCPPMHKRLKTGPLRMNSRYPYGTLVALRMLPRQMSCRSDTLVWPALQTRWRFVGV